MALPGFRGKQSLRSSLAVRLVLIVSVLGGAVWLGVDFLQQRALHDIFLGDLENRLRDEAQGHRLAFDRAVRGQRQLSEILARDSEVRSNLAAFEPDAAAEPLFSPGFPDWAFGRHLLRAFIHPDCLLVLDEDYRVHAVYGAKAEGFPTELLTPNSRLIESSRGQAYMTMFDDRPYVLSGRKVGGQWSILVVTELDSRFLRAALGGTPPAKGGVSALVGGAPVRVLASVDGKRLATGVPVADLDQDYLTTGKAFFDYGASSLFVGLTTVIERDRVAAMVEAVTNIERRQQAVLALVLIATFALLATLFARRLERIIDGVAEVSYALFGWEGDRQRTERGDELEILESRIERFVEEVRISRNALEAEHEEKLGLVAEKAELEKRRLQAQKLEALGLMASGVAHEFNNRLVPITGLADLLAKKLPDGSREQRNAQAIRDSANQARDLIAKVLAYSHSSGEEGGGTPLKPALEAVLEAVGRDLPQGVSLHVDLAWADVAVPLAAGDIAQMVDSLWSNAMDAMAGGGGRLEISAAHGSKGHTVRLRVRDSGVGMDAETAARAFDPFFTTKDVGQGTGMGLSVVQSMVRAAGGDVVLNTAPGRGTAVDVYLPVVDAEGGSQSAPESVD